MSKRARNLGSARPAHAVGSASPAASLAQLLGHAERLMAEGRALLAQSMLEDALALAPGHADVLRLMSIRALMLKAHDEALERAVSACRSAPKRGDLHMLLGRCHKAAGRLDEAMEAYRAAVNLDPMLAEAHVSLGIALKARGQLSDAIACYRRALAINPKLAAAHANLGNALVLQAELAGGAIAGDAASADAAAAEAQRLAVELDPQNAQARANWARSLERAGQSDKAVELLNAALGLDPGNEDICQALIGVLFKLRYFEAARELLGKWLPANPNPKPTTVNSMATVLLHLDDFTGSLQWSRKAEALAPEEPDVLYNIGAALLNCLRVGESLEVFRRIAAKAPHYVMARETLVLCLNYAETDPLRVLQEHQAFGAAIAGPAPADAPPLAPLRAKDKLRVAYLSGDLRRHSVGYFIESLFEAHDRSRIELTAYHSSRHFDEVSARLKACTDHWVPCASLSDAELLKRIRADAVDVLIDLSGATADGRPEVFAQRAAPLQCSYLGYPTTTGIAAMDVRISDWAIDPPGHERFSSETVLRCRDGMFCYRPDSDADVGEPPHLRNGFITFGSFNNLPKYSEETFTAWAEVLKQVPRSKLLIKTKALGDASIRHLVLERFAALGVAGERLIFNPWRPDLRSHLELYREIDIALDTFPYNGATTTCEALWAGVPVVSRQGLTHTSRMGTSILTALGRTEWIAADAPAFVAIASELARSPQVLAEFRANARRLMRESPLMNAAAHARDFEDLLFQAWQSRCEAAPAPVEAATLAIALTSGHALSAQGEHEAALAAYRGAVSAAPNDLLAQWGVARTLANLERVDESIAALRRVLELDPAAGPAWFLLGGLHDHQGRVAASRECYDKAYALSPLDAIRIGRGLLLPAVVPFGTEIEALRADHESALRALLTLPLRLADPLLELNARVVNGYFRLAYHGLGNRKLHELYAALMLKACPSLAWVAPHCRAGAAPRRAGPMRVGFISRFFRQHSIGKTSVGLIEQLARPEFHVTALFVPPRRGDAMAQRIAAAADAVCLLPQGLAESREAIARLELDALFYQDIGMEPHSYCLAFARLAPVQCVSFGHPDTTGIPNIDWWISSEGFEPEGAQHHYSERLLKLQGVGTLAYYDRPVLQPQEAIGRAGFGLPEGVPLLACPQALFKFHPEMDDLLAAILRRLPGAKLLLVQGDVPAYREQLLARWQARGDGIDRAAVFFPPLQHQSFLALFAVADAVLDTLHFNAMNSNLEALALGAPVVTLPKAFQRGRHTQAMYRRMGYTELIAGDEAHYVDLAVRLCTDKSFNAQARARILARCAVLFQEAGVVRGFEAALRSLVAHARPSAAAPARARS
jgi:protein O-GlcNAc transferase